MRAAWSVVIVVAGGAAACSGPDEQRAIDAAPAPIDAVTFDGPTFDAATDAPPGIACTGGGAAAVTVDLGGDALPLQFQAAWWNRGHLSKSCFEIDVVLAMTTSLADPYLTDPAALELSFPFEPVLGANQIQLHLHQPDLYLPGTATLTALTATEVAGSVAATAGAVVVTGTFTADRCDGIFDPCI